MKDVANGTIEMGSISRLLPSGSSELDGVRKLIWESIENPGFFLDDGKKFLHSENIWSHQETTKARVLDTGKAVVGWLLVLFLSSHHQSVPSRVFTSQSNKLKTHWNR